MVRIGHRQSHEAAIVRWRLLFGRNPQYEWVVQDNGRFYTSRTTTRDDFRRVNVKLHVNVLRLTAL